MRRSTAENPGSLRGRRSSNWHRIAQRLQDGSRLPDNMQDIATKPFKVEIQYLPNNPEVSRVKDFLWHNSTVYEWIRFNILLGVIILIVCVCIGYAIIKAGIKKYSTEIKSIS